MGKSFQVTVDRESLVSALTKKVMRGDRFIRTGKNTFGFGQAQRWNPTSVPRPPVLAVAAYSALLLAARLAWGPQRTNAYATLPRWRRNAKRPSYLDLIPLLRKEMNDHPEMVIPLHTNASFQRLAASAAA